MKRLILYALIPVSLTSCLKDNSQYGNDDINILTVNIPKSITIPFTPGVYRFDVSEYLSQSRMTDNSNLSFEWGWDYEDFDYAGSAIDMGELASTESYVEIEMESPESMDYFNNYYRIRITDNTTNITYHADLMIKVRVPYEGSWMILHSDGGTKIGSLTFNGEDPYTVEYDVLGSSGAAALTGNPVALGVFVRVTYLHLPPYYDSSVSSYYKNLFFIITDDAKEAGVYSPSNQFALTRRVAEMVSDPTLITSERLAKTTYIYGTQDYMSIVIDGRIYQCKYALRFYEAQKDDTSIPGDYYLTHAHKFSTATLLYDELGRRILYFLNYRYSGQASPVDDPTAWDETAENSSKIMSIDRAKNPVVVNPLPDDREVVYMGQGPYIGGGQNFQTVSSFALALGKNGNPKSYVYRTNSGSYFQTHGDTYASILGMQEFDTPQGMTEESCFASTVMYDGVIFYSSGSKIYRFDYYTGGSSVIYDHPGGGNIEVMKFARFEKLTVTTYEEYGYAVEYSLGVGINNGGRGEFVVLELSASGYISANNGIRNAQTNVSDFGEIKDIVFL